MHGACVWLGMPPRAAASDDPDPSFATRDGPWDKCCSRRRTRWVGSRIVHACRRKKAADVSEPAHAARTGGAAAVPVRSVFVRSSHGGPAASTARDHSTDAVARARSLHTLAGQHRQQQGAFRLRMHGSSQRGRPPRHAAYRAAPARDPPDRLWRAASVHSTTRRRPCRPASQSTPPLEHPQAVASPSPL